jgi:hypothetical protein
LRIYTNHRQTDWVQWLPITQYVHNAWPSATTKKAPYELIMGHTPCAHQPDCTNKLPTLQDWMDAIREAQDQAQASIAHAQELLMKIKGKLWQFHPFSQGQKVWLKGKNITTTHLTVKLGPKCYGLFTITRVISPMVYQLDIPAQWRQKRLHDCFTPAS